MPKTTASDQTKNKRQLVKITEDEDESLAKDGSQTGLVDQEGDSSSTGSETDSEEGASGGSSEADQILAAALDTVLHQACEHEVVIPPETKKESVNVNNVSITSDLDTSFKPKNQQQDLEVASSVESQQNIELVKDKVEGKKKDKKTRKYTREQRDLKKAKLAKEVADLAAINVLKQVKLAESSQVNRIPKIPPARMRQRKAVEQAKKRFGLTSKYEKLSSLLSLHRLLLQGNPFPLVEPKHAYPYFSQVSGVNIPHIQVLVKAWQEKATRILYQLLLTETKCEMARLKRRTLIFMTNPSMFSDSFNLGVDMQHESEPVQSKVVSTNSDLPECSYKATMKGIDNNDNGTPPAAKKQKKMLGNIQQCGTGTKTD